MGKGSETIQPRDAVRAPPGRLAPERLLQLLQVPVRSGHVAFLDGWRGLCILLVLAGHFVPAMGPIARAGVEFFFVLSGRLMAEILIFGKQPVGTFLKRRVARIVPALIAYVVIVALLVNTVFWIVGLPFNWRSPAAAALFLHNYLPASDIVPAFEHSWSLAVEEHSYLLLVAIALATARSRRSAAWLALAIAALAIGNGVRLWLDPPLDAQSPFWRSDVRAASVLVSFALCLWLRPALQAADRPWLGWVAPLATLVALASYATTAGTTPLRLTVCIVAAAIAVNTIDASATRFRAWLSHPGLVWAGTLSFSLYLWQQLFYTLAHDGVPAPLCFALTVACALWSFKTIENPARDYLLRDSGVGLPLITSKWVTTGSSSSRKSGSKS